MSDKRRADMDAIEIAQLPPLPSDAPTVVDNTSPIDTIISPIPGTPTIVPGDEVVTSGKVKPNPDEDEEATSQQREDALLRQQQIRQQNLWGRVASSSMGTLNSVKNGIGKIPTPVGLALPILTLLILFFLIVQVNGNSRFGWLWLVLTNNAHVEAGGNTPANTTPSVSIPSYASITTPLKTFEATTTPLTTFASVATPTLSASAFVSLSQEFN